MLLAIGLMSFVNPGRILVGPHYKSEFPKLTRKEKREGKCGKKEEKQERKRAWKREFEVKGTQGKEPAASDESSRSDRLVESSR